MAALSLCVALPALAISIEVGDGRWQTKVPATARQRSNPMANESSAVAAGAKLFQRNCASCHGKQAEGLATHPDLHTERVKNATPGELEWLLKNGSLKNGMPSWSRLPEPQRWQLVSFLKSL
ncbi:MAG TPA: cytochrome c [Terriglobales bacterium]|nr:cytochrome c [Terriglobales bacterium]